MKIKNFRDLQERWYVGHHKGLGYDVVIKADSFHEATMLFEEYIIASQQFTMDITGIEEVDWQIAKNTSEIYITMED